MTKIKAIKRITAVSLLCVSICAVALAVGLFSKQTISAPALSGEATISGTLEDMYTFGMDFTVPGATISYGGQDVPATESVVIYPDGKVYTAKQLVLSVGGQYTIVYYATVDGKKISARVNFKVASLDGWDDIAPVITFRGELGQTPVVQSALNEKIVIPTPIVTDKHLARVETFVYYNYGLDSPVNIGVENNSFTPKFLGEYTIVYRAQDTYGNETEVTRRVLISEVEGDKAVTLTIASAQSGKAGTEIEIPSCTATGLYTEPERLSAHAEYRGERVEITDGTFFAEHVGTYTVVYEYATPLTTYTATLDMQVEAGGIVIGNAVLPKYMMKGKSYTLDDVYAVSYAAEDPASNKADVYMRKDDSSEYQKIDYSNFLVDASEKIQFKYSYNGTEKESEQIKVIDVGPDSSNVIVKNYFYGEDFTAEKPESNRIKYTVSGSGESATLDFINVISLSNFSLQFEIPEESAAIGAVVISLIDYYDPSRVTKITYSNVAGSAMLSVDGSRAQPLGKRFAGVDHSVSYSGGFVTNANPQIVSASGTVFLSDKILLQIELINYEDGACFAVKKLENHSFNNRTSDNSNPYIVITEQSGIWEIDSEVVFSAAQVTDVLTPFLKKNLSFSVTTPSGSYAQSLDGVTLDGKCDVGRDYTVKLSEYGYYNVTYTYVDQNGRRNDATGMIIVSNRVAPTIALQGVADGDVITVKVGSEVRIAGYTVSDDLTPSDELVTYCAAYHPTGKYINVDSGKFTPDLAGVYRVVYYCYDAEGNYSTASYFVVAE